VRSCDRATNPDAFCASSGAGDACHPTYDNCRCTSSSQCTNPDAPSCLGYTDGGYTSYVCACYVSFDTATSCPPGRSRCVGSACLGAQGEPCTTNADCASNFCSGGESWAGM
jgi:hypothetical protein